MTFLIVRRHPPPVVLASTILVIAEAPAGKGSRQGRGDDDGEAEVGARRMGRRRGQIRARREAPASRSLALGATVSGPDQSAGQRRTAGYLRLRGMVAEFLTGEAHGELCRRVGVAVVVAGLERTNFYLAGG